MLSFLRKRLNPHAPNATGAISRIHHGVFGAGAPQLPFVEGNGAPFRYHEGDLFTPGAQNYVFESLFEDPILCIWGNGYLVPSMRFDPRQNPPQVFQPNIVKNGMGGLFAGQINTQPLSEDGGY